MAAAIAAAVLILPAFAQQPAEAAAIQLDGQPVQGGLLHGRAPAGTVAMALDGRAIPLAPDGRFLLGFDRDAGPAATVTARLADGRQITQALRIAPRAWRIEHVGMARPSTGPTPEFARLREREQLSIGAARTWRSDSRGWSQHFIWPARGRLSGVFGSQRVYRGGVPAAYHSGTDIAAGAGAPVVAPADGVVTLSPPPSFSLEGNLVIIDHGLGLTSAFLHLARASVRTGDRVRQGQEIGRVGATGRATGPHLHWSMVWNGARLDPQALAGGAPGG
jgi:murein DD-endopeptidase MepM/ murein hydrolase activator NlpD